jgi:hypothetical protein
MRSLPRAVVPRRNTTSSVVVHQILLAHSKSRRLHALLGHLHSVRACRCLHSAVRRCGHRPLPSHQGVSNGCRCGVCGAKRPRIHLNPPKRPEASESEMSALPSAFVHNTHQAGCVPAHHTNSSCPTRAWAVAPVSSSNGSKLTGNRGPMWWLG